MKINMLEISLAAAILFTLVTAFKYTYLNDKPKENQFITDTNGCQYFKKSERPRLNPNGTQICKPL